MTAYLVTGLNNIWNFIFVWAAIQTAQNSEFVFLVSNAILIGSFVSYGVNVSIYAQAQKLVSLPPNLIISSILFLCIALIQGQPSLDTFFAWTLIWAIEMKEKLRIIVASNLSQKSANGYLIASTACILITLLVCYIPGDTSIKKTIFVLMYLIPCGLIRSDAQIEKAKLRARFQPLLSEVLPFLSGFLVLTIPFWLLDGGSFNEFRLILSYVSVTSPFLQMAITYRLRTISKNSSYEWQKHYVWLLALIGIAIFFLGNQVVGLILSALASASLHANNKFSESSRAYSLLSAVTPTVFLIGGSAFYLFQSASLNNMLELFLLATISHVTLSWVRRFAL